MYNLNLDEILKNYVVFEKHPSYLNTEDVNEQLVFNVPTTHHIEYVSEAMDIAIMMGSVTIDENGNYIIPDGCYINDDGQLIVPMVVPSDDRITISVDSNNRFIDNSISR